MNRRNNKENNTAGVASSNVNRPDIMPDPDKATIFMQQSLEQLHDSLVCPLCHNMLKDPSTLGCAHTFCFGCIEVFSRNNSLCPVKGCGIPLSVTGSRQGSFLKTNPSIETVLTSFQTICQTLDRAPKQWWRHGEDLEDDDANESSDEEMITLDTTTNQQDESESESEDEAAKEKANWLRQQLNANSDDEEERRE